MLLLTFAHRGKLALYCCNYSAALCALNDNQGCQPDDRQLSNRAAGEMRAGAEVGRKTSKGTLQWEEN